MAKLCKFPLTKQSRTSEWRQDQVPGKSELPLRACPACFIYGHNSVVTQRAARHAVAISNNVDIKEPVKIEELPAVTTLSDGYNVSSIICNQRSDNKTPFAFVGMTDIHSYELVQSYSHRLHIPFIATTGYRRCNDNRFRYDLLMNPSYIPAVLDFVQFYGWKQIFYLYNSGEGFVKLIDMYDLMAENKKYNFKVIPKHISDFNVSYDILHEADRMNEPCQEKIFFIDLKSKEDTNIILRQIIETGMNRVGYNYIIGGLEIDTYDLSLFYHGGANISGFKIIKDEESLYHIFLEKWYIPNAQEDSRGIPPLTVEGVLIADGIALLTTSLQLLWNDTNTKEKMFQSRRCHFYNPDNTIGIRCDSNPLNPFSRGPMLMQKLKQTKVEGLSGHVSFNEFGQRTNYSLSVYSLRHRAPLKKGDKPFVMCKNTTEPCPQYEGFLIDLLAGLQELVKFNYTIVPRPKNDSSYGKKNESGGWTGLIGELVNEHADLALAPMTILEDRQKAVFFTKPFMKTGLSLMLKRPDKRKPGIFSFKDPLGMDVWICILFGFLSVSVIIFLIGRFSPYEWKHNSVDGPSEDFGFLNSCWSSLGALMQQGSEIFPNSVSGRCAESAWWFFTLILISSYTANLAAFLTIENLDFPIDSVDKLAKQSDVKYGIIRNGASEAFFNNSPVTVHKRMRDDMINLYPDVNVDNAKEGWEKVKDSKGKYAFIIEGAMNDYYNQRKPCTTVRVGNLINHITYGIATRKGLAINEELNLAVLTLKERGDIIKLKSKWWLQKGQCGDKSKDKSKTQPMSLSNVSGMFHILIGGLVIAMVTAVIEYVIHGRQQKNKYTVTTKINGTKKTNTEQKNNWRRAEVKTEDLLGELEPLNSFQNTNENRHYNTTSPANLITINGADGIPTGTLI
ncbi:hypothetical protein FSP39_023237 [Pinctada imbricata]|uniref:Uncharacterized protein n=1 Tax=Pinctada imbricata TaxID=66713 RepID=A0AA88Y931_PINIB|nr:hypothetical protein FSP39_023237 [Pinctada imbricata]